MLIGDQNEYLVYVMVYFYGENIIDLINYLIFII